MGGGVGLQTGHLPAFFCQSKRTVPFHFQPPIACQPVLSNDAEEQCAVPSQFAASPAFFAIVLSNAGVKLSDLNFAPAPRNQNCKLGQVKAQRNVRPFALSRSEQIKPIEIAVETARHNTGVVSSAEKCISRKPYKILYCI
jgi:hypothetical protein